VPGFDATSWYGIFVPAKTPAPIMQSPTNGFQDQIKYCAWTADTPVVQTTLLEYVKEKSVGLYGHSELQRRRFIAGLSGLQGGRARTNSNPCATDNRAVSAILISALDCPFHYRSAPGVSGEMCCRYSSISKKA
jgi:hypothetical protein